jgi:esterase/lipase
MSGEAITSHRGTSGVQDVFTDVKLSLGLLKNTARFKHAKKIQKAAEAKYGSENVTTVGHSLGGALTQNVGQNTKAVTLNKAVPLSSKRVTNKKQHDIRARFDPISAIGFREKKQKQTVINAPLFSNAHGTSVLKFRKK